MHRMEPQETLPRGTAGRRRILTSEDRDTLRGVALDSIRHGLKAEGPLPVEVSRFATGLREPAATFVTLDIRGRLRGCVGSLFVNAPLVEDVSRNAYAAAFRDYRFPPVSDGELPKLGVHISLLTPPVPFEVTTREELIRTLRPGEDGLLLEDPPFRSTFLPQVWESLPDPDDFLSELFLKAGLPPDHWSPSLQFRRYRVEEI